MGEACMCPEVEAVQLNIDRRPQPQAFRRITLNPRSD
jgi:hypothetical protein